MAEDGLKRLYLEYCDKGTMYVKLPEMPAVSQDAGNLTVVYDDPVISKAVCQACGTCASQCPIDAIQIGDFTDAAMIDQGHPLGRCQNGYGALDHGLFLPDHISMEATLRAQ